MYKVSETWKCTEWPQTKHEHLSQKYSIYTKWLPMRLKFCQFRSTTSHFWDTYTRSAKIGKCTEWPQTELRTLNSQKCSIYSKKLPWAQNFGPFCSTISCFRDITCTRSAKSEMHWMTPNWTWTLTKQSKLPCIHYILTPEAQILVCFTLRLAVSEIQHVQDRWK